MDLLFPVYREVCRYRQIFKITVYNSFQILLSTTLVFNILHFRIQHHYVSIANPFLCSIKRPVLVVALPKLSFLKAIVMIVRSISNGMVQTA